MWNDLVFDPAGNLYVPDDKPRIWRVSRDGTATIWFTDPRLTGFFGFAGGPLGGRIDPTGTWLYVSITVSAEFPLEAVIYRVRLVDHPTAADLELVHRFPFDPSAAPPQATGLAFAKSGNLYVSLLGPNEIAVLSPSGDDIRRIASPLFRSPWGLAFVGEVAARDERRSRTGRPPGRLDDLQGRRRRGGVAAESADHVERLKFAGKIQRDDVVPNSAR